MAAYARRMRRGRVRLLVTSGALVLAACGGAAAGSPPSASTSTVAPVTAAPSTTTTLPDTYLLQPGDSPSLLADRFGLTIAELDRFNADNVDYLDFLVGAEIRLTPPPTTTAPPTTAPPRTAPPTTLPAATTAGPTTVAPALGRVTMAFTGDVLTHRVINREALQTDGSYDYTSMLTNIAPLVSAADLAICHLEAPVAPAGEDVMVAPERLSSAASITTALAAAGFDRCSTASNHTADRGAGGVDATVAAFAEAGIAQSGMATSGAERLPAIVTVNGVRVAHLSYAYGFDGRTFPAGEQWRGNLIDPQRVIDDAVAERARGAEVVVVSLHWGASQVRQPTADQRAIADAITASGQVDLIVGHHAHVLQPISQVNGVWVVWGLGDFLSDLPTSDEWGASTQDGALVSVTFERSADGTIAVGTPSAQPTWCDKDNGHIVRSTAEQTDPALSEVVREQLRRSEERTRAVLGEFVPV